MQTLKYKKIYKIISTLIILINLLFITSITFAKTTDLSLNLKDAFKVSDSSSKDPLDSAAGKAGYNTGTTSVLPVVSTIITTVLSILGVIFLILTIYAGFNWMTAAGKEEQVTKAKDTLTAAIIGLIIVMAAYAISFFVISKLGTATLTGLSPIPLSRINLHNFEEIFI